MNKFFKTLVAIFSAMAMLVSFAACNSSKPANTTTQETTAQATEAPATSPAASEDETDAETETETATIEEVTSSETTTEAVASTAVATTAKATTTKKGETTNKQATTAAVVNVPTSKADILAFYNNASAKLVSSKPGFKKSTTTAIPTLEMGALAKIEVVRGAVGDFLGEGSSTASVAKGKSNAAQYVKSSLKASDITNATCKLSADKKYYEIQLTVINETNPIKGKSALGRFTKDYKDQQEILAGLKDVGASAESVTMKTTSVVINAKISVDGSKFSSLSYSIKTNAQLTGVKYTIVKVKSATGKLQTSVKFTGFAY